MNVQDIKNFIIENSVLQFILVIFTVASAHWILMQLYIYLCIPPGIWGFLTSFITMGSPICHFINYIQFELSKNYITIWAATAIGAVTWVIGKIHEHRINL
jgi:hypothetical protein